jgi:iron complex outermembrane receptor protein
MNPVVFPGTLARALLSSCAPLAVFATMSSAVAQTTELPEVLITAPSPIQPARVPRPAQTSAPQVGPNDSPSSFGTLDLRPIAQQVFAPVTVLPEGEIRRSPATTIGDLVDRTPGVTGSAFAAGANRPIIRGLDNNRVRLQENGIGSMDVSEIGEDHGVPIDPLAANRVEIIRGPATLRWGSQAIGGVVSIDNNRIPMPDTPFGLRGIVRSAFSTVDNGREGAVVIDGRHGAFAVHADFFKRVADSYNTPRGRQANTQLEAKGFSYGTSYIFQNGFIGASITHFASDYGIPGVDAAAGKTHIDMRQTKFNSKGEVRIESAFIDTLRFWYGGSFYKHDERGLDAGIDTALATFKNREHEARVEAQLMPVMLGGYQLRSALGLQAGMQRLRTGGEAGGLVAPADTNRIATYLFNELQLSPLTRLQFAGRIENVNLRGTETLFPANFLPNGITPPEFGRGRNFVPISLSAGILHELSHGIVASLTAQRVERAPTALELFSRGTHEATGTFEIGNGELKTERAYSVEAGLRKAKGPFRFDATVFHTRYQGYIFKRQTGTLCGEEFDTCGVDTELKQVVFSQRDARFTGAELTTQFDVMPLGTGMFGIENQFDVVRARFSDGTNVPRIPPMRIGGGVFWYGSGFFTRVNLLHAFAQKRIDPTEETATKGYNLLKAEVSYKHAWKAWGQERELHVGVTGTNLLNAEIRHHTSFKKNEVLQPGRNFKLFASLRF